MTGEGREMAGRLRAFVLGGAPDPAGPGVGADGVSALNPADPFALAVAAEADITGHVLVVGPSAQQHVVQKLVSVAVARWPELKVAWRVAPVGNLALVTAAATAVRGGRSPGFAVHCFDSLLERAWAAAWVRSVGRLHEPTPSLRQHLGSWLPGGRGYLVVQRPSRAVLTIASTSGRLSTPTPMIAGRDLLLVGGDAPQDVTEMAAHLAGATTVRATRPVVDPKQQYGVATAVEYVALGAPDPAGCADGDPRVGECPACSLPLATPACPFCHAMARTASRGAI